MKFETARQPAVEEELETPPRPRLGLWFVAVVSVAALPRLLTAGRFATTDEPTWMTRAVRFSDALTGFDLSHASASLGEPATMPGGPTMWIGTVGRGVWRGARSAGIVESTSFFGRDGLAIAQFLIAIVTALLIGWLFVAVSRWVGLVPALVAALLVATEPWIVGLGAVLHTDEMTALLGTIGLVELARALAIPDPRRRASRPALTAGLAGVALMASTMTKVTGLGYWTGAAVLGAWALIRHRRDGAALVSQASPLRLCAVAAGCGAAVVPLLWPAVIVDPVFQFGRLVDSAGMAAEAERGAPGGLSRQFFLGDRTNSPGWSFYPVAVALRVSPWFLLSLLIAVPIAFARAATRAHALVFATPVAALFLVLGASPKGYDRYALLLLVPLTVVVGLGVSQLGRLTRLGDRVALRVIAGVGVAMLIVSVAVAPWGLAYFNPALGGSRAGEDNLLVGWGEGSELAAARIQELEGGSCNEVTVSGLPTLFLLGWPCAAPPFDGGPADYVVRYISTMQRSTDPGAAVAGRELVDVVEIRGIPYAEIWR